MRIFNTLVFIFLTTLAFGQKSHSVKGVLTDTLDNPLIYATIVLMEKADSTMVSFTRTELDGSFKIKDVPAGDHILKTTYVGYIPLTVDATSADGKNVDLGTLKMTEMAQELMEVVIKAAKAQIKMRGDTIEYDASTFKVPEGSSVEELLKKLPGMEVDLDGNVTSEGKDVSKVTVDGKNFFGSDPKAAIKNLPAEGIAKVQVFDKKTESEKVTGISSNTDQKEMNLQLKEDYKSGGFGRITAGAGTENRLELKGNYNRFNDNIQLSVVGVGNNTGRNGLSWDDYQDFMGSQSFRFTSGSEYGFAGGRNHIIMFGGGGGSDIESSVRNAFFSRSGNGFPESYSGGINFNYNNKKTEFSSVYYYYNSALDRITNSKSLTYLQNFTIDNLGKRENNDANSGHRVELALEQEVDSLTTLRMELNTGLINTNDDMANDVSLSRSGQLTSNSISKINNQQDGNIVDALVILRRQFKKRRRNFGVNVGFVNVNLDDVEKQNTSIDYFQFAGGDSTQLIDRSNVDMGHKQVWKANATYTEPLTKKLTFNPFYNFRIHTEGGSRLVEEITNNEKVVNGFLSRDFENQILYNRFGSSLFYAEKKFNVTLGLAYQSFGINGWYKGKDANGQTGEVNKTFSNWVPHLRVGYTFARNSNLNLTYSYESEQPSISQLQPIVDNSNPFFIRTGNIDLTPELKHSVNLSIHSFRPAQGIRLFGNIGYTNNANAIITDETVDENLVTNINYRNFENAGYRIFSSISFGFPIVQGKLKANTRMGVNGGESVALVNGIKNITNTRNYSPSLRLTWTPKDRISLEARARFNIGETKYNINTSQNQNILSSRYSAQLNTPLFAGLMLNTSFNLQTFENNRFGLNRTVPIWNASIYRQFYKKKAEVRLSVYDALNKNLGIQQNAFKNRVFESTTSTLARYIMLSLTYNLKGLKDDGNKRMFF